MTDLMTQTRGLVVLLIAALAFSLVMPVHAVQAEDSGEPRVLVFSKTAEFRHGSIESGIAAVEELGGEHGFAVDATEDATAFTTQNLAQYAAVIWLSTTGSVLDADQQAAFEHYIENGGGYVGVHAASDTHYDWAWYGGLVGAYFADHPHNQTAEVKVADHTHPSTEHLPKVWERYDEWYNFQTNPRGDVHVLMALDETTFEGGSMGHDHPLAWCQYYNGGRSWFTGAGHTDESFEDESAFRTHLAGGILWAAGMVEHECGATVWDNYEQTVLADDPLSPMGLEVAEDGRVFFIERAGRVRVIDPESGEVTTIGTIPVYTSQENGLLGMALDPNFASNDRMYFFYSPPNETVGDDPRQHVSRFTLADGELDLTTEQVILEIPHQREGGNHSAGYLQFGPSGDLFITTGDDTSPWGSDLYAPIDERPGRSMYDAQRTSGNSNDLRGKLLRITPRDDGGYDIPEGNLFSGPDYDGQPVRAEIYAMGLRNPFRFTVDAVTETVYLADYGPDATEADPDRGPQNHVTWHIIDEPANIGWPYCIGPNRPYIDYDFETGESGEPFDCDGGPVNDSPHNTGIEQTPPVQPAEVWYHYSAPPEFPMLSGGSPMAGPRYYYDEDLDSDTKFPRYLDGVPLFYQMGDQLFEFRLDDDDAGVYEIKRLLDDHQFLSPIDMTFGPHDGALYLAEWGTGGGNNPDARIVRYDYVGAQIDPIAMISASPTSGGAPLQVEFSSDGSSHPQGAAMDYHWDFGDGATSDEEHPTYTYTDEGNYTASLTLTDFEGRTGSAQVAITVGNNTPDVTVLWPPQGAVVDVDASVPFEVEVADEEDGSTADGGIACTDVDVRVLLTHDEDAYETATTTGCEGAFTPQFVDDLSFDDDIHVEFHASYTDRGSPAGTVAPLTGSDEVLLQPSRKQAEHHDVMSDVRTEETSDPEGGGENVGWIEDGDFLRYSTVNLANIDALRFRVASGSAGGTIEVRQDEPDGPLLGSAAVENTGGFQSWDWVETDVADPGVTFDLVLVFRSGGERYVTNINFFDFVGEGAAAGPSTGPDVDTPELVVTPAAPDGDAGWYVSPVTYELVAADPDHLIEYRRVGDTEWTLYEGPGELSAQGTHNLEFRARLDEDTSPRGYLEVQLDALAPETTFDLDAEVVDGGYTGAVDVELTSVDTTSGVAVTQWRHADEDDLQIYDEAITVDEAGDHTIEFRSIDVAGNVESWQSASFTTPSGPAAELNLRWPADGSVVADGVQVPYEVELLPGGLACDNVEVRVSLLDDGETFPLSSQSGCTGAFETSLPDGHDPDHDISYQVEALYREQSELTLAREQVLLQPERKQAQHHDPDDSVRTEPVSDSEEGGILNVGWLRDGAQLSYSPVNLANIDALRFRVAVGGDGGVLEARKDTSDGQLLASVELENTGGSQSYVWLESEVVDPGGSFTLVLVFRADHDGFVANFNFMEFVGSGAAGGPVEPPADIVATLDPPAPDGDNGWHVSDVTLGLATTIPDAVTQWRPTGLDEWESLDGSVVFEEDGVYELEYRAVIEGEEPTDPETVPVLVGQGGDVFTPDDIAVSVGDTISYELAGGMHNVVTVDESGAQVATSGAPSSDWGGPYEFEATNPGSYYIYCIPHADVSAPDPADWTGMVGRVDIAEQPAAEWSSEIGEVSFKIDQGAPSTSASVTGDEALTVSLDAHDAESGVAETHWREAGADSYEIYETPVTFEVPGTVVLEFRSVDVAGNVEDWEQVSFEVTEPPAMPELELTFTTSARCIAGNAFLVVTAFNDNATPVDIEVVSDYGTRTFVGVSPERFASHAFNTRGSGAGELSVTVRASASIDGDQVTEEWVLTDPGLVC